MTPSAQFLAWFDQNFASKSFPWKDGMKPFKELPASFRALTFTQALADWRREHSDMP